MRKPAFNRNATGADDRRQMAMLKLLADDDPAVYRLIRSKLIAQGSAVAVWLRFHVLSADPVLRRRIQEILTHFGRQEADTRFLSFCLHQGEIFDLEEALWLFCQTRYPDINVHGYQAWLDSWADAIRPDLQGITEGAEPKLAIINQHLFGNLRFRGNEQDYYAPENSYLNHVLDQRTGNPVSLCLVYLLLARRLGLPMTGIGLPGHFICRYQSLTEELYLDAFNRGKLLTKADCIKYLNHTRHQTDLDYLQPLGPRRILQRICANLHQIHTQNGQTQEVERLQRYLITLSK